MCGCPYNSKLHAFFGEIVQLDTSAIRVHDKNNIQLHRAKVIKIIMFINVKIRYFRQNSGAASAKDRHFFADVGLKLR
jgi:hypothetical protein